MDVIRRTLVDTLSAGHPMSVRQVYYQLTTLGVIDKTESEYKRTVCRLLADMRRSGEVPYHWLADATRWMRKPTTYGSLEDALRSTAATYRRALWNGDVAVEIWLEKEALAGVVVEVTEEWDVPLMVTRGYPSMSFLYSAANSILDRSTREQRTIIYYFGDRDPSGVDIDRAVVNGIGEAIQARYADDGEDVPEAAPDDYFLAHASFQRVAVTEGQIREWNLPTRPTKKSDSRSKNFDGESVELDAIPADRLRGLVGDVIERHVDQRELSVLRTYEEEERRDLWGMMNQIGGSA